MRFLRALGLLAVMVGGTLPAGAGEAHVYYASVRTAEVSGKVSGPRPSDSGTARAILVRMEIIEAFDKDLTVPSNLNPSYTLPTDTSDPARPKNVFYFGCIEVKTGSGQDGDCRQLEVVDPPAQLEMDALMNGGTMTFTLPTTDPQGAGRLRIANVLFSGTGNPQQVEGHALDTDKDPPARPTVTTVTAVGGIKRSATALGSVRSEMVGGGSLSMSGQSARLDHAIHVMLRTGRRALVCIGSEPAVTCPVDVVEDMLPV